MDTQPHPSRTRSRGPRWGRGPAFALVGVLVLLFLAASAAPSPLYPVWAAQWGATPGALTAVFAVYALTLLAALLVFGRASDVVGRRPVLLVATALELVSLLVFLTASDVALLLLARAVQGVATGLAIGTAGAALLDLAPPQRPALGALVNSAAPTFGLGLGALGSGAVVELAAGPAGLVFGALATLVAVVLVALVALPETAGEGPGPDRRAALLRSLRPSAAVPAASRRRFAAAVPVFVATWALGALQLSLGPSVAREVLHVEHPLAGAALVASFSVAGGTAALLGARASSRALELRGALALGGGSLVSTAGLLTASLPAYATGTVLAGAGFGAAFAGALRAVAATAAADRRGSLLTSVYVVSYLAFSLPALAAGELSGRVGLLPVVAVYTGAVVVLAAAAALVAGRAPAPAGPALRTSPTCSQAQTP
ncbi:MFS transporter [Quadrisphaera setariae]|uniref:MFS transporter n=1 Tax=Quadrisphaera setariae TaxID=2593304 RepID=A0A5C8ZIX2_9ACTN|nr:MFS transporter [Quadrisphaera setariae]TXR57089.1 MFS transporter [Quadrisphaera setariae]